MSVQENQKKKRTRRSPERMAELVLEAERIGASKVCQREGIAPAQLSRWKEKLLKGGIAALKQMKTGPRQKVDPEITVLQKETERLKEALLETSIELQLIRKKSF
jgi:transposase-like protein